MENVKTKHNKSKKRFIIILLIVLLTAGILTAVLFSVPTFSKYVSAAEQSFDLIVNPTKPIMAKTNSWYRGTTPKADIKKITFTEANYIASHPEITESEDFIEEFYADVKNIGTIRCFVVRDDDGNKELLISGNNYGASATVYANANSGSLFGGFYGVTEISGADKLDTSNTTCLDNAFDRCSALTRIDVSEWNTSKLTSLYATFWGCGNLLSLDVSKWDTSKVTTLQAAFSGCGKLESLDVSNWNTESLVSLNGTFNGCGKLTSIDVSKWNVSKVTDLSNAFYGCKGLTELDVTEWNTCSVKSIKSMFDQCSGLKSLDLSGWDTSSMRSIYIAFYNCCSMKSLDLSGWDTSKVTNMQGVFFNCYQLNTIIVSDSFVTTAVTDGDEAFLSCGSALKGGAGTVFDSSFQDYTYARIDGGVDNPGYFTRESYTLKYNANGGTGSIDTDIHDSAAMRASSATCTPGVFTLSDGTALYKTGYYLDGWNTKADGTGISYAAGADYIAATAEDTLYAVWKPRKFVVTLKTNDAAGVTRAEGFTDGDTVTVTYDADYSELPEPTRKGYEFVGWSSLPEGYREAEYLESTGTQSINTKIKSGNYYGLRVKFAQTGITITDKYGFDVNGIAGLNNSVGDDCKLWYNKSSSTLSLHFHHKIRKTGLKVTMGTPYELEYNKNGLYFNGSRVQGVEYSDDKTNPTDIFIRLFCVTDTGTRPYYFSVGRMYLFFAYGKNGQELGHFIPCYRKADNKPGMYDAVTDTFFTNEGTGKDFTVGEDVEYITSSTKVTKTYDHKLYAVWEKKGAVLNKGALKTAMNNTDGTAVTKVKFVEFTEQTDEIKAGLLAPASASEGTYDLTYTAADSGIPKAITDAGTIKGYVASDGTLYVANVLGVKIFAPKDFSGVFKARTALTEIDGSALDTSNVTNMSYLFYECTGLTSLNVSGFDTANVTQMNFLFLNCRKLTSLDASKWNTGNVTNMESMFYGCSGLTSLDVSGFDTANVTNMESMFYACSGLTSLDVSNWNTANVTNMVGVFRICGKLTNLDVSGFDTAKVTNMSRMFQSCNKLTSPDVAGFDTSNVTNMDYMFYDSGLTSLDTSDWNTAKVTSMVSMFCGCNGLTSLNLSGFDTAKVTDMSCMFQNCSKLISLDVSGFDTANVTNMSRMFQSCSKLTSLDTSDWNTAKVTSMATMFYGCSGLASLDVSGFNTAKVTNMSYMFQSCSGLTSLDVSGFDTANVTNMSYLFNGCSGLTSLDTSDWNTGKVTSMAGMFSGCSGLTDLDVSGLNTANVTDMSAMFNRCSGLASLDISGFDTANVTNMGYMFYGCSGLASLDVSKWNTGNVTNMSNMFYGCSGLTDLDVSGFNTANVTDMSVMFYNCSSLTDLDVSDFDTANVTNMSYMFFGCSGLMSLDVSGFDTGKVTNTINMFNNCSSLTYLDVSGFDTAKVTNMNDMFSRCSGLTSLDISGFDTAKVNNLSNMFYNCSGLTSLDVSGFDTTNVTNMRGMFFGCSGLTSLDVSGFDTANVTTMSYTFYCCSGLNSLDLSKWNKANVTDISAMFYNCSSLTDLDVSDFDTANVTNMSYAFYGCSGLNTIYAGDGWTTANVGSSVNMFSFCGALRGGAGTAYNGSYNNKTYARIDGGTTAPGYFTRKSYTLKYDANEGTGSIVSVIHDSVAMREASATSTPAVFTLSDGGALSKAGYSFNGWNTAADGTGTHYAAGESYIALSAEETLFAEWITETSSVPAYTENSMPKKSSVTANFSNDKSSSEATLAYASSGISPKKEYLPVLCLALKKRSFAVNNYGIKTKFKG